MLLWLHNIGFAGGSGVVADVLIDGANSKSITSNYGTLKLYFNGTHYYTL